MAIDVSYLNEACEKLSCPLLNGKERKTMILEYRVKARKLAYSLLKKWHCRIDQEELVSVVDLSLCEAVSRFDPERKTDFITFLFYHLKGNLIRSISTSARGGVLSLLEANGNEDSTSVLGGDLNQVEALDAVEALNGRERETPDSCLLKKELITISRAACQKLGTLEREIIERIYLQGEQLQDVAEGLGYSRCHVSRIKKKALSDLKNSINDEFVNKEKSLRIKEVRRRRAREGQPAHAFAQAA